jgi:hypothetical protein
MPVPEAAVHKDQGGVPAQNYVRAARETLLVQAKAKACAV